jgi:hypothetical protein
MSHLTTTVTVESIQHHLIRSFESACAFPEPYPHWLLSDVFQEEIVTSLLDLPFRAAPLTASGTREVNNATRHYFDREKMRQFEVMAIVAEAFQSRETVAAVERLFGASLAQTYLRTEYALDADGFWLEPHTDIGPKRFTMLTYISRERGVHYGTDVYWDKHRHCKTVPYDSNTALVFVPSDKTWHGVEKREMTGARKSVIVNYVSGEWRSKEQLSFPDTPVY